MRSIILKPDILLILLLAAWLVVSTAARKELPAAGIKSEGIHRLNKMEGPSIKQLPKQKQLTHMKKRGAHPIILIRRQQALRWLMVDHVDYASATTHPPTKPPRN
ncbi:hypothetical protein GOP47_0018634 [Adiantum capillus-veneris]|uniref:Uncharacterized protein n=1 Tax=Adiantum capillus-veneris TaxID=13818 RepID=A0A9D4Z9T3_ADICA|nr:hypothetical protein GOP47_0018634 [Adiantum capillus-veneris]